MTIEHARERPLTGPDDLATELNPHKTELNPHGQSLAANRAGASLAEPAPAYPRSSGSRCLEPCGGPGPMEIILSRAVSAESLTKPPDRFTAHAEMSALRYAYLCTPISMLADNSPATNSNNI